MHNSMFQHDGKPSDSLCGMALSGPQSGVCRDPNCRRHAAVLIAGYCTSCVSKHGLSPLTLTPQACEPERACR